MEEESNYLGATRSDRVLESMAHFRPVLPLFLFDAKNVCSYVFSYRTYSRGMLGDFSIILSSVSNKRILYLIFFRFVLPLSLCYNLTTAMEQKEGYIPVEGGKVWYQILGKGVSTPMVFLHGGPGFPSYNFSSLEELGNERKVIIYHQLGAGKSDRPNDPILWVFRRFIDELETVVRKLELKEFHLLGHSWGTALAVEYALRHQDKVKSLLLLSPLLNSAKWIADANKLKKNLPKKIQIAIYTHEQSGTTNSPEYKKAEEEFHKKYWCRLSPLPESVLRGKREGNLQVYITMWGPSEFYCTGNLKNFDITSKLPELKIPVLFACGKFDEATPQTVKEFKDLVPHSKMTVFEKSAHHAEIEEKGKFISTVKDFLKEL